MIDEGLLHRWSASPSGKPSIVVTSCPWALAAMVRQDATRRPSMCTVQAPHCPWSQPFAQEIEEGSASVDIDYELATIDDCLHGECMGRGEGQSGNLVTNTLRGSGSRQAGGCDCHAGAQCTGTKNLAAGHSDRGRLKAGNF
jgi:hypothetical protein